MPKWVKKVAAKAAGKLATISTYAGWVPFCQPCTMVSFGLGMLSAGAYTVATQYTKARQQVQGTVAGAVIGGTGFSGVGRLWKAAGRTETILKGGFGEVFDAAAKNAERTQAYRKYWGLKIHFSGIGVGQAAGAW